MRQQFCARPSVPHAKAALQACDPLNNDINCTVSVTDVSNSI